MFYALLPLYVTQFGRAWLWRSDIKPRRDRKTARFFPLLFFTQRELLLMRPTTDASIRLAAAACGIFSDEHVV